MTYLTPANYPILHEFLSHKERPLQATYTVRDAAAIFGVSTRTIQSRVAAGQLRSRNLPGHARFLSADLEEYIANSVSKSYRRKAEQRHA